MGRHQTGRRRRQSVANSIEAMTAASTLHDDECNLPSQIGVRGSSAGEANHADPVFHPSNGEVQTTQCPQRGGGTAPGDDLVGRTLHGSQWSVLSRTW